MDLNIPLEEKYLKKLNSVVNQKPLYCIRSDINLKGKFSDACRVGMTESVLFVFDEDDAHFYPLNECEAVIHRPQANGVLLNIKTDGIERLVARGSMSDVSNFASIAKGAKYLIEGEKSKRAVNNELSKVCKKCGRVLPGTKLCPKCDDKYQGIKRLAELCKPHTAALILVAILLVFDSSLTLLQEYIFRLFVDNNLASASGGIFDVLLFFIVYFAKIVVGLIIYYRQRIICSKLSVKITYQLRQRLNEHLQKLSLSFFNKRNAGELIERVSSDTNSVQDFITNCMSKTLTQALTMIALIIIMLIMNWKLALMAFAFMPFVVIFVRTFWPRIRKIYHHQWRKNDKIHNKLQDVLSGIRIVKTYGKEEQEIKEFCDLNDELAVVQEQNEKFFATFFPLLTLTISFSTYLIIYLGGQNVLGGTMSVGELMQFIAYANLLAGPISWMSFLPRRIIRMTTSMERIYDVLDEKPEITSNQNSDKSEIKGDISLKNVCFGYRSYEPVLENINLEVKKGEVIGLVGSSGSGKSTFINLIMRLYDVDEGTILIDGKNIKDFDLAAYHNQIGVVLQETFLFAGTVLENIRFAKPNASLKEIIKAAKAANAHEFICKLPDGYNTYIGERGHNLSGGEKQRVAIARAILNDPKILILDEATSALDTESEYQVQQALERLRKGRTTFAIAHRLSTLRCADRIAVINEHNIAELGTHNELLKQKGIYYSLVMAQLQMNKTASDK